MQLSHPLFSYLLLSLLSLLLKKIISYVREPIILDVLVIIYDCYWKNVVIIVVKNYSLVT